MVLLVCLVFDGAGSKFVCCGCNITSMGLASRLMGWWFGGLGGGSLVWVLVQSCLGFPGFSCFLWSWYNRDFVLCIWF